MNKKVGLGVIILTFFVASNVWAAPKVVLNDKIVENFIKSYTPMMRELEKIQDLDIHPESSEDAEDSIQAAFKDTNAMWTKICNNPEAFAILKKHGWNKDFPDIFLAILAGMMYNMMEIELGKNNIDSPEIKPVIDEIKNQVHKNDMAIIKKYYKELYSTVSNEWD